MNLMNVNTNPLSIRWDERYSAQPSDIKEKLDDLDKMAPRDYQLRVIKRIKKGPIEGDVFILSPREGIYFYGKVLKANIQHISKDIFINGKNLIFVFKNKSREISIENYNSDYNNLLIEPAIVDKSYWSRGYFYTISNEKVTDFERNLDYGFYSIGKQIYYKENGDVIDHEPILLGTNGIATIFGIASEVERELIFDPALLRF